MSSSCKSYYEFLTSYLSMYDNSSKNVLPKPEKKMYTLNGAKDFMRANPGKKITCDYFHNEWIMFDGHKFVFEDGISPDEYWWNKAQTFETPWYEYTEKN